MKNPKRGRPALAAAVKRNRYIHFGLTRLEMAAVESAADRAGRSVTDFCRMAVLGKLDATKR